MTAARRRGRIIAAVLAVALVGLGVGWLIGSSSSPIDSAASDGYLGLRLLLERQGATVDDVDGGDVDAGLAADYDVVFVLRPAGVDRTQLAEWHQYVAAGGRLVLGQPDTDRPGGGGGDPTANGEPGNCDIEGGASLPSIRTGGVRPHHVFANERSCYGDGETAIVTSATCLQGVQFTLSGPEVFDNETMGAPTAERLTPEQRGNATLAAAVLTTGADARVAVVSDGVNVGFGGDDTVPDNEPRCADTVGDDSLWQIPGSAADDPPPADPDGSAGGGTGRTDGSVPSSVPGGGTPQQGSDDGEGTGTGDGGTGTDGESPEPPPSIFDFLSPGFKLALAQLFAVLVWYAWRRSRRRGVVVEDEKPVELRSSRLVEAVGALRRRGGEAARAGDDLRQRTRTELAGTLGLGHEATAAEVAAALGPRIGVPTDELVTLLGGPPVLTEAQLMTLANDLRRVRDALTVALVPKGGPS